MKEEMKNVIRSIEDEDGRNIPDISVEKQRWKNRREEARKFEDQSEQ
jgi:hypothetical protein